MKTDNKQIVADTDTLPFTSVPYSLSEVAMFAIQAKQFSGSSVIKLQGSCDDGAVSAEGIVIGVSLWSDIVGGSQALASGDDVLFDYVDNGYRWVRVVVTGTGSITVRINTKGV